MLSRYIPDKLADEIEQSLNERQITQDKMVRTIKYLDVNQDVADSTANRQLIKETIMSIEKLLPETCRYFNEMYFIKHGVLPALQCFSCKQGIHENCCLLHKRYMAFNFIDFDSCVAPARFLNRDKNSGGRSNKYKKNIL